MCITRRSALQMTAAALASQAAPALGAAGIADKGATNHPSTLVGHRPLCGLHAFPNFEATDTVALAPEEAQEAVKLIFDAVGIEQNFEVLVGDFSMKVGGFATIRHTRRFIVYDGEEFHFGNGRTDWVAMGVMAHEIGHHLAAHVYIDARSSQEDELEADRFAGVALSRLGATLKQALAWTANLSTTGGDTHPPRDDRIVAVELGWHQGERLKRQERGSCTPQWHGDAFLVEGRQCRMATTCDNREEHIRLACEAYDNSWN